MFRSSIAIVVARRKSELAYFVAHRAQADAQQLGRPRPVAAGGFEGHGKKLALHFAEREAGLPLRGARRAKGRNFSPQIFFVIEGLDANLAAARQSHRPAHEVPELAHIARPGMLFEMRDEFGGQANLSSGRGIEPGEIFGQFPNIAYAVAQRRQGNGNHVKTIVKIGAEAAVADRGFKRMVAGRNDADINVYGLVRSQAVELALLQGTQQFRLERQRHFPHLIEQQGATVGRFELAGPRADRSGEGAAGVSKQFTFE